MSRNTITVIGGMARMDTRSGCTVILDASDAQEVGKYTWNVYKSRHVQAAVRGDDGKQRAIRLQNVLFPALPHGTHVLFRNRNPLDFRRCNLDTGLEDIETDGLITRIRVTLPSGESAWALIDNEDADKVLNVGTRWQVLPTGYVYRQITPRDGQKRRMIYLSRLVMNCPYDMTVDHIFHNKLDNRKSQLRVLPQHQNSENRQGADVDAETGIRNVNVYRGNGSIYYLARVRKLDKTWAEYFPYTPYGLEQAKQAATRMRATHFTHSR